MIKDISRFSFPTDIVFGPGAIRQLPEVLKQADISKPLIVTDPGLMKTDVYTAVKDLLDKSKISSALFSNVNPNPLDEDISKALIIYEQNNCDGVIGLGGGSALDAAKVVPVLAVNKGKINDYDCASEGNLNIKGPLPPMIAVPTTSGTGSEVGRCSVITSIELKRKFMVCNPQMMPKTAVLDPELTVGLPPFLTAATGMDAFVHCLESLTAPVFHPMCDAIAIKGIELVAQYLKKAVDNPGDIEARGYMQLAAMMGAVAFQKDLGAAHSLSHALSAVCNMHHGLANAVCLIPVMKYNKKACAKEYAKTAACFGINTFEMPDLEAADKAIDAIANMIKNIGLPGSLAEAGVKKEQLEKLADKAFLDPCHQTNARPCTREDLLTLFEDSYYS